MKTYKVNISRMEYGWIMVEAEDEQEATDKATVAEFEGSGNWVGSGDLIIDAVDEIKKHD